MTTLGALLRDMRQRLASAGVEDPAAEARILIGGLLGLERTEFISRDQEMVADDQVTRIVSAIERRLAGEPPYRILGQRGFHGLELSLGPATLEPRPDTEILVDTVLELLANRREAPLRLLDLGTGTGAICLALLSQLPQAQGIGTDLSADALCVAEANAARNGLSERFTVAQGNWFEAIAGRFDVIVSNPPYIASAVIPTLDIGVRAHDPLLALDGGEDGLDAYRLIAAGAIAHLEAGGLVAVETGYDQRVAVEQIFVAEGFELVKAVRDYAGNDRVQCFQLKNR